MVSSHQIGQWNLSHSWDDFRYEMPACLAQGKVLQGMGTVAKSSLHLLSFDSHPPEL